ncbi:hypothetical protein [Aestuariirhabdus litorea]|uniref:Uncharacterized protein n=1 Tax=Aestuariirhabdus litorea TaxID=2528527 RepID=A0A3P3VM26_9GAMM|nr:hypothetical protein [Aestuariirhabdus litorea]RRJ83680.1 hypothetical protein D0544_00725 [Aestuariirhabdus litorea]RWW96902.1 hypothetical protein DZC74_00725 [Endozoicomonadaceae bacterium GTF-13]
MRNPGIQVVCLGLLLLGIVLLPTWLQRQPPTELLAATTLDCPLKAPCLTTLEGLGEVAFSLSPTTLPHSTPLKINLRVPPEVQSASVQFIGKEMYMGLQPVLLEAIDSRHYQTTTRISYCTIDTSMNWLAEIRLHTREGVYQVTFTLETTP